MRVIHNKNIDMMKNAFYCMMVLDWCIFLDDG